MILDALLSWVATAVHWVLGLLPALPTLDSSGWTSTISTIWQYAGWANDYLPLDQAGIILGLIVTAYWLFYGLYFVLWVLDKLHITGGN